MFYLPQLSTSFVLKWDSNKGTDKPVRNLLLIATLNDCVIVSLPLPPLWAISWPHWLKVSILQEQSVKWAGLSGTRRAEDLTIENVVTNDKISLFKDILIQIQELVITCKIRISLWLNWLFWLTFAHDSHTRWKIKWINSSSKDQNHLFQIFNTAELEDQRLPDMGIPRGILLAWL